MGTEVALGTVVYQVWFVNHAGKWQAHRRRNCPDIALYKTPGMARMVARTTERTIALNDRAEVRKFYLPNN